MKIKILNIIQVRARVSSIYSIRTLQKKGFDKKIVEEVQYVCQQLQNTNKKGELKVWIEEGESKETPTQKLPYLSYLKVIS